MPTFIKLFSLLLHHSGCQAYLNLMQICTTCCAKGGPQLTLQLIFSTRVADLFTALRRKLPRRSASSRKAGGKGYKLQSRFQCHLVGKCGPKEKSHNLYQWLYHILTFAYVPLLILYLLLYLKAPVRSQCVSSRLDNHLPPPRPK